MSIRRKPELDATKVPTALDIAWTAGFYEGEGHCSAKLSKAAVCVTQKDPEMLYKLRDWFGGSVRFAHCKTTPPENQCHIWLAYGDRARFFLAIVYPYLGSRRKAQADATGILEYLGGTSPDVMTIAEIQEKLDSRLPFCTKNDPDKIAKKKLQKAGNYRLRRLNPEYVEKMRMQSAIGNAKKRAERLAAHPVTQERVM